MALVRDIGFDVVNTAAYSARPNTPAAEWQEQVADLIKMDRLHRLNALVNDCAAERSERCVAPPRVRRLSPEEENKNSNSNKINGARVTHTPPHSPAMLPTSFQSHIKRLLFRLEKLGWKKSIGGFGPCPTARAPALARQRTFGALAR
jgi:tRNA A37 methylthiotransferase MiaB